MTPRPSDARGPLPDSDIPLRRAAVATLVATEGSSPREAGARMWVGEDGSILGSVTIGGCVDARVIEESAQVLADGTPRLLSMALGDEDAWALGMTCAGNVTVLVEPTDPASATDPVTGSLRVAGEEVARGRRAVVVVALDGLAGRIVVPEHGEVTGTLGDPALDVAATNAARERLGKDGPSGLSAVSHDGSDTRCYFEIHQPPLTVVVFGATHVAMPLVDLARALGMRTVVVDGRERFATPERFPGASELIVGMPSEIADRMALGPRSIVVLLSHDYKYDLPVLRAVLASDAPYIGCLGSARRGRAMLDFLAEEGIPGEQLDRICIPVGLDIGAKSAAEIALSVLAEGLARLRGRPGGPMKHRTVTAPTAPS